MLSTTSGPMQIEVPETRPLKRCAIIGTAPSWTSTPWQDTTLEIFGLNDAHVLGMPRVDRWFDLHPFSQMAFMPKGQRNVSQFDVPLGAYLRPVGHLEWLQSRPFPVMVQETPLPGWPTAERFPIEDVCAFWQRFWPWRIDESFTARPGAVYEASTPALMLMWAVWAGYSEIHIYGIHLATEWEYVAQRPNFEMLIGVAAGLGIRIVLPEKAPICKASYRYAYETKGDLPLTAAQREIDRIKHEGARLQAKASTLAWWQWPAKKDLAARLALVQAQLLDARQQHQKAKIKSVMS